MRCAADLGHVPLVIEFELWRQREVEPAKARGEELFLPSDSRTLTQPAHLPLGGREDVAMRIDDTANQRELDHVGLGLTEKEAQELRDVLDALLRDPSERHEHVSSSDFQRELTVWLARD